ncbi:MAG: hypothetical protein ACRDHP_01120 [Ktedonobacterales bacterium]
MARTFQRWDCGKEFAERLRWHAYASLRQGMDCSLLIFRPLDGSLPAEKSQRTGARTPLSELAERIRPYVRRTDAVELDEPSAVVVIAHGADREGAHAAFQRLRGLLAVTPLPGDRTVTITIGYATSIANTEGECALAEAIRDAWKPRVLLSVAFAAGAETAAPASDGAAPKPAKSAGRQHSATSASDTATAAANRSSRRTHLRLLVSEAHTEPVDESLRERARALGVPFVQLPSRLPVSCRDAIAPELARELNVVAIGRSRSMLTVAMHDPHDAAAVLRLRSATGLAIFPVLAASDELERALRQIGRA